MKIKAPDGKGFDVVVWQLKPAGETYCAAYTDYGISYLTDYFPVVNLRTSYEMGVIHPREFMSKAPQALRVGGISPGNRSPVRINPPLQ